MKRHWIKLLVLVLFIVGIAGLFDGPAAQQGPNTNVFYNLRIVPTGGQQNLRAAPQGTPEDAAREFLLASIRQRRSGTDLAAQSGPQPTFSLPQTVDLTATKTKVVRFAQTRRDIPIFGTSAVVEVGSDRQLVSLYATLANIGELSTTPRMNAADALESLLKSVKPWVERVQPNRPPALNFFHDEKKGWRLAYLFLNIPALPAQYDRKAESSFGSPSESIRERFNFLVDAEDGGILRSFAGTLQISSTLPRTSSTTAAASVPTLQNVSFVYGAQRQNTPIQVPVLSKGFDDDGQLREFNTVSRGKVFELVDPMRHIRTFDVGFRDPYDSKTLKLPSNATPDFGHGFEHFISAHANAQKVFDFYNSVLTRKGILDDRTYLVSLVDCTLSFANQPPEWKDARWDGERMLFGQAKDKSGQLRTYARLVEVVGHELTHGVIQNWGPLIMENQSGALNESLADIMGVLRNNWDPNEPKQSVANFNWEVGSGFGENGLPIRDLSNPRRTKSPDHMKLYDKRLDDSGGVHANANIHNKAAFNLLTAVDAKGQPIIPWKQVALLYYYANSKVRLESTFSEWKVKVQDTAKTLFSGAPDLPAKLKAIAKAYDDVGIK